MDGIKSDLATKLLNSSDAKVAAAAKRIFFETEPVEAPRVEHDSEKSDTKTTTCTTSLLVHKFGTSIPTDIQEAASTVAMMAPKHNSNIQNISLSAVAPTSQPSIGISLTSDDSSQSAQTQTISHANTQLPVLPLGKRPATNDERLQRR